MPALPVVPNVIRIDYHFQIAEDINAKCREYWQYTGGAPSNSDLNALGAAMSSGWDAQMKQEFSDVVLLESFTITDLTSPTSATVNVAVNKLGTRSGTPVPADVALLASGEVSRRYRGGHSRVYWPAGVVSDFFDAQTWKAVFLTEFGGQLANFHADIYAGRWGSATNLIHVNVSLYEGFTVHTGTTGRARNVSTPRGTAIIDVVIAEIIRLGIATIRKRLLRLA